MTPHYGVCLTNYGEVTSTEASIGTASLAEALGYASVWVSDHIVVPQTFGSEFGREFLDPFVCLSFAAAETKHVLLGTTVVVVPLRSPFAQAKLLSTLDYLSGGRVIFGVGAGWDKEEFDALNVPFAERGRMTDEYLSIMQTLWRNKEPTFKGHYHSFSNIAFEPKPVQTHIPIWVGGYGQAAVRRTKKFGDAWHPSEMQPARILSLYEELSRATDCPPQLTYRMYLRPTDISPAPLRTEQKVFTGDQAQIIEYIESYTRQLPLSHLVFEFVVSHAADLRQCFEYMAHNVLPRVRGFG